MKEEEFVVVKVEEDKPKDLLAKKTQEKIDELDKGPCRKVATLGPSATQLQKWAG